MCQEYFLVPEDFDEDSNDIDPEDFWTDKISFDKKDLIEDVEVTVDQEEE